MTRLEAPPPYFHVFSLARGFRVEKEAMLHAARKTYTDAPPTQEDAASPAQ